MQMKKWVVNVNKNHNNNTSTLPNPNQVPEPAPFTIVHSYATKLRANQANNEIHVDISPLIFTTRQVLPAVIFKKEDFMTKLAKNYKFTLVGKFSNTMPKIELISNSFI